MDCEYAMTSVAAPIPFAGFFIPPEEFLRELRERRAGQTPPSTAV
jgi:hypothetical protein